MSTANEITQEQLRALTGAEPRRNKYGNRRTYVATLDRYFDSAREARWAATLLLMQQQGDVRGLRFQVRYDLVVNGTMVGFYTADFVFEEREAAGWRTVVADAKPPARRAQSRDYVLRKKLMAACWAIEIREL